MANGFYNTITDYPNAEGMMPLLYSIRDGIPYAFPSLLFVIFLLIFGGNYFVIKSKLGKTKIFVSLLASSLFTTVLSLFLALAQLVVYKVVLFYAFLTIVSFVAFLVSDNS